MAVIDVPQQSSELIHPRQSVSYDVEGWQLQVSALVDDLRSGETVEKIKVFSGLELIGRISELALDTSVETKREILHANLTIRDRTLAADELGLIQPPLNRREKRSFKEGVTSILFDINLLPKKDK